jgi:nucleotide-binding universal stress UspA family protein
VNFQRILAAIDFSDESISALQRAAALATANGAELHVLHVIPALVYRGVAYQEPLAPDTKEHERAAAEKALTEAVNGLGDEYSSISVEVLEGEPRTAILSHANTIGADLIVVASKGHGRLREVLLGSVAAHISHAATCSVLIVKN